MVEYPEWYDGKNVNEVKFCEEFLKIHPMKSVNGTFFTVEGRVTDEDTLRREIYERLKPFFQTGLTKRVANLLEALRLEAYAPDLPIQRDRIHVANGMLFLDGRFSAEREFCRNRLPVAYNEGAAAPETWLRFLGELLYPEDIPTLQEFMGYCLLPTTKGQKMLMLIGRGGEGKSRIGVVLRSLLGTNMATGSISKIETSRFARADLEHELVMLDDDMKIEALPQTNYIKAIVTAELPMDLERKGQQSYQGDLYVRFLGFGNGSLKALYDRSEGFFRRQIILTTRPKDASRTDDPFIAEKMCAEAEGIFLWCLEGLQRLIANSYSFTLSERAREQPGHLRRVQALVRGQCAQSALTAQPKRASHRESGGLRARTHEQDLSSRRPSRAWLYRRGAAPARDLRPSSNLAYKRTYVRSYTENQLSDDFLKKPEEAKSEGIKPD